MPEVGIYFQGVPHSFAADCRCVPCGALRRAVDENARPGCKILKARSVPWQRLRKEGSWVSTQDLTAITGIKGLPCAYEVSCDSLDPDVIVIIYPGIWASHRVLFKRLDSQSVHLRFEFQCTIDVTCYYCTVAHGPASLRTNVTIPDTLGYAYLEQMIRDEDVVDLVSRFCLAEEVVLNPGDVAWEEEGRGRMVIGNLGLNAVWYVSPEQIFQIKIDSASRGEKWNTHMIAMWLKYLETIETFPAYIFNLGIWVEVCRAANDPSIKLLARRDWKAKSPILKSALCFAKINLPDRDLGPL